MSAEEGTSPPAEPEPKRAPRRRRTAKTAEPEAPAAAPTVPAAEAPAPPPAPATGPPTHAAAAQAATPGRAAPAEPAPTRPPEPSAVDIAPPARPAAPANRWRGLKIVKVVVNAGVGESGDPRTRAERVLTMVAGQKPISTRSHSTNRDFGIRKGQEIGAKVTLRGTRAREFLDRALDARDRFLDPDSIDRDGNFSFGIADYTDFAGMKYDPQIGIHGMDVCVEVGRAGWRIRDRRARSRPIPSSARVTREETRRFLQDAFRVNYLE
jgi:large subunit ribosomal protein L5